MPRGPTGKRPVTRARLKAAALDVFAERGFHGTSIGELATRAGLTRGAFYSNFATKDELFFELFDEHSARTTRRLHENFEAVVDTTDPVRAVAEALARGAEEDPQWFLISTEFTLYAIRTPAAAARLAEHDARIRAAVADFLGRAFELPGPPGEFGLLDLARLVVAVREGGLAQSLIEPAALPHGQLDRWFVERLVAPAVAGRTPPRATKASAHRSGAGPER